MREKCREGEPFLGHNSRVVGSGSIRTQKTGPHTIRIGQSVVKDDLVRSGSDHFSAIRKEDRIFTGSDHRRACMERPRRTLAEVQAGGGGGAREAGCARSPAP